MSTDDIIEWKNKGISETIIQEYLKERKAPKEIHAEITGKIRNPWGVLGLAIITLGIYLLVWIYKVHEEVRDHSKSGHDISPGLALGLCFIPIFNFIWLCIILGKLVHRVNMMQSEDGYEKIADPGWPVFWYIVGLGTSFIYIPLGLVSFVLVQNALNKHWKWHQFKTSPVKSSEKSTPTSAFGWGLILTLFIVFASIGVISDPSSLQETDAAGGIIFFLVILGGGILLIRLGLKHRY